ncbi:hypothetical protein HDV02_004578 [Globomyces sp. JEL0801]|nr:hypothetical protein HDV02_004578 [Globomyces sp. JEL0801]
MFSQSKTNRLPRSDDAGKGKPAGTTTISKIPTRRANSKLNSSKSTEDLNPTPESMLQKNTSLKTSKSMSNLKPKSDLPLKKSVSNPNLKTNARSSSLKVGIDRPLSKLPKSQTIQSQRLVSDKPNSSLKSNTVKNNRSHTIIKKSSTSQIKPSNIQKAQPTVVKTNECRPKKRVLYNSPQQPIESELYDDLKNVQNVSVTLPASWTKQSTHDISTPTMLPIQQKSPIDFADILKVNEKESDASVESLHPRLDEKSADSVADQQSTDPEVRTNANTNEDKIIKDSQLSLLEENNTLKNINPSVAKIKDSIPESILKQNSKVNVSQNLMKKVKFRNRVSIHIEEFDDSLIVPSSAVKIPHRISALSANKSMMTPRRVPDRKINRPQNESEKKITGKTTQETNDIADDGFNTSSLANILESENTADLDMKTEPFRRANYRRNTGAPTQRAGAVKPSLAQPDIFKPVRVPFSELPNANQVEIGKPPRTPMPLRVSATPMKKSVVGISYNLNRDGSKDNTHLYPPVQDFDSLSQD